MLAYFQTSKPLYEPKPYGDCKLPITPAADPDIDRNSGLRFGKNFFFNLVTSSGLYFHVTYHLRGCKVGCVICCFTTHSRQTIDCIGH